MSLARLNRLCIRKLIKHQKKYSNIVYYNEADEYTAAPQYPQILDLSPEKVRERKKLAKHEQIKTVKSVEEKLIKLNMPKYYGFKCYMFDDTRIPYGGLELVQHITRTHLIQSEKLPEYYKDINVNELVKSLESSVQDAILMEYEGYSQSHQLKNEVLTPVEAENVLANGLVQRISRIIVNAASNRTEHLKDIELDVSPRIESFWSAGGMIPPERVKSYRRGNAWTKPLENEPTDRVIQFIGSPLMALRTTQPLLPIVPLGDCENAEFDVPFWRYDPRSVGIDTAYKHVTNIPGFWPGDSHPFGLLSFHSSCHLTERTYNDRKDALDHQGALVSFAWLNAQAAYQGFNTFNEITYPLVTQSVLTNGRLWATYVYQLNTLLLHSENTTNNPKKNICWTTGEKELFKEVQGGRVIGFNNEVLQELVKLYSNVPEKRLGLNLKPYLGDERLAADYSDPERRTWLEREYKYLMSNRPRYKLEYEIYAWEKIFKIDHKMRLMEPRRRPFELFQKPWNRKLDERKPVYVPRKLRPHLRRDKGRNAPEFFP